jgi:hypothetical protein
MVFHMSKKEFPIIGTKSSILWDEATDAWSYISGRPVRANDSRAYFKAIPTLFRAVDIRASAIANLPWSLMRGETEYETSQDYENKTGLVSNMNTMLYLIEASLVLAGSAYWKREKNRAGFDKLRHLDPTSMELDEKKARNGVIEWKRNEPKPKVYTPKEIIYLWYPDPFVEIGPPSSWPVKSALNACGVLANVDEFARDYFGRGAIKAMLFSMQGASRATADEFENWWNKYLTGIKNAFRTKVLNAETVSPVVIGEGIQELAEVTLSQEKREEIAIANSIPMSILFANAANYATAERDKLNWYEDKVVIGLRLKFNHETLDIFQEDENERSNALQSLTSSGVPLDMALRILGFELTDEDWAQLEREKEEKEQRRQEMMENMQKKPDDEKEDEEARQNAPNLQGNDDMRTHISLWQKKAGKAIKKGKSASVPFDSEFIPETLHAAISGALESVTDEADLDIVFDSVWMGYP